MEVLEDRFAPAAINVTTIVDDAANPGSLRYAINKVNDPAAGIDEIRFKLGGGEKTITINKDKGPLPNIIRTVAIDGTPLPGQPAHTIIITAGQEANALPAGSVGLAFARDGANSADNSQILGLTIHNFPGDGILLNNVRDVRIGSRSKDLITTLGPMTITKNGFMPPPPVGMSAAGIRITGAQAQNNTVLASYVGTNSNSDAGLGNSNGILIEGTASFNTIGGTAEEERNTISGNSGVGVWVSKSNNNTVIGNYIGSKRNGTQALPNSTGVLIDRASNNIIGGIVSDLNRGVIQTPANLVSGNSGRGIIIAGPAAVMNRVYGNFVGTDKKGTAPLGNGEGIHLVADQNVIGGPQAGARNVISANGNNGINSSDSQRNRIENNNIGLGPARDGKDVVLLPNEGNGIDFSTLCALNEIKNTKIHPKEGKISIVNRARNRVLDPNSIFGNGYAIYNGTPEGMPVLSSAVVTPNPRTGVDEITISGTLSHAPRSTYTLEFFGNTVANRQAERFLEPLRAGDTTVTTDSIGFHRFTITFKTVYGGWVTATSTGMASDGFTSEVSEDVQVIGASRSFAAVGDRVWLDLNGNGLQDKDQFGQDEPGVAGVTVVLHFADGGFVGRTTTDATGYFVFRDLLPGDYYLQFLPPSGYDFTLAYQGDSIFDSDADPLDGATAVFSLIAGQVETTFDAGLVRLLEGAARRFRGPRRR